MPIRTKTDVSALGRCRVNPNDYGILTNLRYIMRSPGPNQYIWWSQNEPEILYDPTNGTVSDGGVMYFNSSGFDLPTSRPAN